MIIRKPNDPSWKTGSLINDITKAIDEAKKDGDFGPFVVCFGSDWATVLIQPTWDIHSKQLRQAIVDIPDVYAVCISSKLHDGGVQLYTLTDEAK